MNITMTGCVKMNKTIIVVEGASAVNIDNLHKELKEGKDSFVVTNMNSKMYHLVDGEYFEVVSSLKKVEK